LPASLETKKMQNFVFSLKAFSGFILKTDVNPTSYFCFNISACGKRKPKYIHCCLQFFTISTLNFFTAFLKSKRVRENFDRSYENTIYAF